MSPRYALLIAWTKVRARKVRTVLSALISAFMLVILVSMSMGFTGARNAFKSTPGISSEKARGIIYGAYSQSDDGSYVEQTLDTFKVKYPDANITKVYSTRTLFDSYNAATNLKLNGNELATYQRTPNGGAGSIDPFNYSGVYFNLRSDELLEEDVSDKSQLALGADGTIPIVVNAGLLLDIAGRDVQGMKAKQKIELMKQLRDEYTGKEITLASSESVNKTEIKFKIVGIAPKDGLMMSYAPGSENAFIPASITENKDAKDLFNTFYNENYTHYEIKGEPTPTEEATTNETPEVADADLFDSKSYAVSDQYIVEFGTKDELRAFAEKHSCNESNNYMNCTEIAPYRDALLEFDEEAKSFWSFAKWVVGFFAGLTALFLFFTTSKVAADSRKETGVFRAMGANRMDIAKVYITYIAIITTISYFIAILISLIILSIVTAKQADDLSVTLTELSGNYAHAFDITFIGFNPLHMLGIWLLSITVGLIGGAIPILRNVLIDPIKAMRTD